jgi:rubrerythrin
MAIGGILIQERGGQMPTASRIRERRLELFNIFKMAIKAEQGAQKMYRDALLKCDDDELKTVLASLRDDEKRHEEELLGLYGELERIMGIAGSSTPSASSRKVTKKRAS